MNLTKGLKESDRPMKKGLGLSSLSMLKQDQKKILEVAQCLDLKTVLLIHILCCKKLGR